MSADTAMALLASLVMEDGRTWGEAAHPRQIEDAALILDLDGPRRTFLTRPRGGSKTTDLAGIVIAAMICQAPIGAQLYCAASDRDQAALILDAFRGFVARTPHLLGLFAITADRVEYVDKAVSFHVLPADSAGAWGLRPYLVVVDEICQHPDTFRSRELYEALVSALPKVPLSRLVLLSTAGSPTHWSFPVWQEAGASARWHRRAWTAADGLAPTPWQDPDELDEMRRVLTESSFRRLFLNEWVTGDETFCTPDRLDAMTRPTAEPLRWRPDRSYVVSLDVGLTGDRTAIAVQHLEVRTAWADGADRYDGRAAVVDALAYFQGSKGDPVALKDIEAEVERLSRRYGHAPVVFDPYQAVSLGQSLRDKGLRAEPFTFSASSKARLAATALHLVRDGLWSLPPDPVLRREMLELRVVERTTGQIYLDHPAGGHDDVFMAVNLGAHYLMERLPKHLRAYDWEDLRLGGRSIPDETSPSRFGGLGERQWIEQRLQQLGSGRDERLAGRR